MSEHTKGPWYVQEGTNTVYTTSDPASHTGVTIALFRTIDHQLVQDLGEEDGLAQAKANAHRIVACVNALEGLDPEGVPDMVRALRRTFEKLEEMRPNSLDSIRNMLRADIRSALQKAGVKV